MLDTPSVTLGKRKLGENKFGKQFNIGFKRDDVRVKSEEV